MLIRFCTKQRDDFLIVGERKRFGKLISVDKGLGWFRIAVLKVLFFWLLAGGCSFVFQRTDREYCAGGEIRRDTTVLGT